jgi:DNA-directed RNA polymerase specialized sigma24 family protein
MRRIEAVADLDDTALLDRMLHTSSPTAAWREFLRRYSELILKIVWQGEYDHDAVMERYLYVCRHLAEDDFQRLRQFDPSRTPRPKLSTWLTVVVRNLCIEHHRRTEGRRRYPKALARLSEFDRKVFALYYWEGYAASEIEHMVTPPDGASVPQTLRRIEGLALRSSKTWNRPTDRIQHVDYAARHGRQNGRALPSLIQEETIAWLEEIVAQLPGEERLVVQLRFWEDLSAPQIARVLQTSSRRVYYVLSNALEALRERAVVRNSPT